MRSRPFWIGLVCGSLLCVAIGLLVVPVLGLFSTSAIGKPGLLDWWGNLNLHNSLHSRHQMKQCRPPLTPAWDWGLI